VYGERERVRLKLILRGKRLGLALSEIGELLDLYEVRRNERAQLTRFLGLLADRRTRLLQQRRTSRSCSPRSTASSASAGGGSRRSGRDRLTFT
jgi:DNA-binding transcriptional MerR regulator